MPRILKAVLFFAFAGLALGTSLHADSITCLVGHCTGPAGDYYVTNGIGLTASSTNPSFFLLHGLTDSIFPATDGEQYAIALDASGSSFVVSLMNRSVGDVGPAFGSTNQIYSPSGTPISSTPQTQDWLFADDGTTDGTSNYFMLWNSPNQIYQASDPNWNNPTLAFTVSYTANNPLGITYDPTNDSFWVSDLGDNMVYDVNRSGAIMSGFQAAGTSNGALALDPTDGTLWMSAGLTNTFEQYSKSGTLLQELTYNDLGPWSGNIYGGEAINATPEPGTWMMLSSGIGALGLLRRKRVA